MAAASKDDIKAMAEGAVRAALDSSPPGRGRDEPVTLDEKTRVSWPVLLTVVSLAGTIAGSFAMGNALAQRVDDQGKDLKALHDKAASHDADLRLLREVLERLEKKVDRIESKIDKPR